MASRALASQGAKVYITGRRLPVLESAAKHHNPSLSPQGGSLVPLQLDVTSKDSLLAAAKHVAEQDGRLHVLVNNAGVEGPVTHFTAQDFEGGASQTEKAELISQRFMKSESFEDWDYVFRANVHALQFASMAFLPLLAKGNESPPTNYQPGTGPGVGTTGWTAGIVNITSISGIVKSSQNHYGYNASKAAANHLTQMLAHELRFAAKIPVRVNAIAPGLFLSEMTTVSWRAAPRGTRSCAAQRADTTPSVLSLTLAQKQPSSENGGQSRAEDLDPRMVNPAERTGSEAEMGQAVLFSASNLFTTGVVLPVDGGFVTAMASNR